MDLRELKYGIEIETVKRTRGQIAWAIHTVVGGHVRHIGTPSCYDPWKVERSAGPKMEGVNDASLTNVPSHLQAELVSPVLTYDDLEELQEVVRGNPACWKDQSLPAVLLGHRRQGAQRQIRIQP